MWSGPRYSPLGEEIGTAEYGGGMEEVLKKTPGAPDCATACTQPEGWLERVNRAETEAVIEALRRWVVRGRVPVPCVQSVEYRVAALLVTQSVDPREICRVVIPALAVGYVVVVRYNSDFADLLSISSRGRTLTGFKQ